MLKLATKLKKITNIKTEVFLVGDCDRQHWLIALLNAVQIYTDKVEGNKDTRKVKWPTIDWNKM